MTDAECKETLHSESRLGERSMILPRNPHVKVASRKQGGGGITWLTTADVLQYLLWISVSACLLYFVQFLTGSCGMFG